MQAQVHLMTLQPLHARAELDRLRLRALRARRLLRRLETLIAEPPEEPRGGRLGDARPGRELRRRLLHDRHGMFQEQVGKPSLAARHGVIMMQNALRQTFRLFHKSAFNVS
jgi:plasmid stabilization system protein ParE